MLFPSAYWPRQTTITWNRFPRASFYITMTVNFESARVKDFYWLLNRKANNLCQYLPNNAENFSCQLNTQVSRENKLREFHFKFLHQIVVTKKELCSFGIKDNSECLYCGEQDLIEHTFPDCFFTKNFLSKVVQWFVYTMSRSAVSSFKT